MTNYVCEHCKAVIGNTRDDGIDFKMWRHMYNEHHIEFKKQKNKEIKDLFKDNFIIVKG